jgi:hypothetical protein
LLILTSGSVIGIEYKNIFNLLLVVSLGYEILKKGTYFTIKKQALLVVLVFFIYISLNIYESIVNNFNNLFLIIVLLLKMLFFGLYSIKLLKQNVDVVAIFAKLIFYLSFISFIVYILVYLKVPIPLVNQGNIPIYIFLCKDYGTDFNASALIRRNAGIFFEPGLYHVYLNFALIYFWNKLGNYKVTLFLILNIVLTFSPIGYLITILIITAKFIKLNFKSIVLLLLFIVIGVIAIFYMQSLFVGKEDSFSYYLRYLDFQFGSQLFLQKPFLGWGIGNEVMVKAYFLAELNIERGLSNGLLGLLYQAGIVGTLFYMVGYLNFVKKENINNRYIIYGSFITLSLLNENIFISNFMMFIVIYGYQRRYFEKSIIYRT